MLGQGEGQTHLLSKQQGLPFMPRRLVYSDEQIADLGAILGIDRRHFEAVLKKLRSTKQPPLSQPALGRLISEALLTVKEPEASKTQDLMDRSEALARFILWLGGLCSRNLENLEDLLEGLETDLQDEWIEDPGKLKNWHQSRPHLAELLKLESVQIATKALDISYEYANVLQYSRIMTDVRPIFNEDADEIRGAVVSFTLRMNYYNAGEGKSLSIALDAADLRILSYQCNRALQKAETAKKRLSAKSLGIPSTIAGEDED